MKGSYYSIKSKGNINDIKDNGIPELINIYLNDLRKSEHIYTLIMQKNLMIKDLEQLLEI